MEFIIISDIEEIEAVWSEVSTVDIGEMIVSRNEEKPHGCCDSWEVVEAHGIRPERFSTAKLDSGFERAVFLNEPSLGLSNRDSVAGSVYLLLDTIIQVGLGFQIYFVETLLFELSRLK